MQIVPSPCPETQPSLDKVVGHDSYLLDLIVDQLASNAREMKRLRETNKRFYEQIKCPLEGNECPRKKKKKDPLKLTLESLGADNPDVLGIIVEHLGLHAVNLRQTCKTLKDLPLSKGVALALVGLQTGPSIPFSLHLRRRTTRACTLAAWDYFSWRADEMHTQTTWALFRKTFTQAPINDLIDAFMCVPEGKYKFFGSLWLGKHSHVREGEVDEETDEEEGGDNDYMFKPPYKRLTSVVKGSDYTSHLRLALYKAIEERMWNLCMGKDLGKPMATEDVVPTLTRVFKVALVDNDRCFHFTHKGWLKYTPFLLAAECHNLELLRYLRSRNDTCLAALSAGGNSAYAICKNAMKRRGATEQEIAKSPVLEFLTTKCNLVPRSYIPEGRL